MRIKRVGVLAGVVAAVVVASASVVAFSSQQTSAAAPTHATSGVPRYQHIFYIFHLGCLANSCPAAGGVQPMTPLFRASGDN